MVKLFKNKGFGWVCVQCTDKGEDQRSRLMLEGEAESKLPKMSLSGRAVWKDKERTTLICPDCNVTEELN